jgi:hypothetical protein
MRGCVPGEVRPPPIVGGGVDPVDLLVAERVQARASAGLVLDRVDLQRRRVGEPPVAGRPSTSMVIPAMSAGVASQANCATFSRVSPSVPSPTKNRDSAPRLSSRQARSSLIRSAPH